MLARPEPAFLMIADISGYTGFLAGAELDHAQDILADLVSTVVRGVRPPFRLSKLEGDAAFVHLAGDAIDPSRLLDTVEATYFAFRRRLRDIKQSTTCDCNACVLMPHLDLKFVVHHGSVIHQRVAGREELVGSDVIVTHRLLKNDVIASGGPAAYALFTDACLRAAGADPSQLGLVEHRETYDVGEIVGWVDDLTGAWAREVERRRLVVDPADAMVVRRRLPVPPSVAWDRLTSPAERPRWSMGVTGVVEATSGGRRGIGTTNHCIHGAEAVVEEILDWEPFDHVTLRSTLPAPGAPKLISSIVLEADGDGTEVSMRYERPRSKGAIEFFEAMAEPYRLLIEASLGTLVAQLEAEKAASGRGPELEPALPESDARFLTPITG